MEEQTEANRAPMTIKSMARETRLLMVAEATKHGLTMAQYLDRVMAAGGKPLGQPMVIPPNQPGPRADPREMIDVAVAAAQLVETLARAGVPLTAKPIRSCLALITELSRAARGLPQQRARFALRANGQTTAD